MKPEQEKFETWAVVELFGHQKLAGLVTEASIGGCSFVRLDVPEVNGISGFTRFLGQGSIYSIIPTTEEVARSVVAYHHPRPIQPYELSNVAGTLESGEVRRCRVCGCTDDRGCDEGYFWVADDLCSNCADPEELAEAAGI